MLDNTVLHTYITHIFDDLHARLEADLSRPDSRIQSHMATLLQDMAVTLKEKPEVSASINRYLTEAATYMGPQMSDFLTGHIKTTIENWDEQEMAEQIELNIGKDLQKVRINGTLVGGLIGGILYMIELGIGSAISL